MKSFETGVADKYIMVRVLLGVYVTYLLFLFLGQDFLYREWRKYVFDETRQTIAAEVTQRWPYAPSGLVDVFADEATQCLVTKVFAQVRPSDLVVKAGTFGMAGGSTSELAQDDRAECFGRATAAAAIKGYTDVFK